MTHDPVHVADVIDPLFDRGNLPERVTLLRPRYGDLVLRAGTIFEWSDELRGYVREPFGDLVYLAGVVRVGWGFIFGPAPAEQMALGIA